MDTAGGDKYECDECGYKGELIGVAEAPGDEDADSEREEAEEEIESPAKAEKANASRQEMQKKIVGKTDKASGPKRSKNASTKEKKVGKKKR